MKSCNRCTPISWNSKQFLIAECYKAVDDGTLAHFAVMFHKGEYDIVTGKTDKDHAHCLFIPSGTLEWTQFFKRFDEPDPVNMLPIRLREDTFAPPQSARQEHKGIASFLLYAMHDEAFLAARGEERQYHYAFTDFNTDNADWLNELFIHFSRKNGEFSHLCKPKTEVLRDMIESGNMTVVEAFKRHWLTPWEYRQWRDAYGLYAADIEKAELEQLGGKKGINRDTDYAIFIAHNQQKVKTEEKDNELSY